MSTANLLNGNFDDSEDEEDFNPQKTMNSDVEDGSDDDASAQVKTEARRQFDNESVKSETPEELEEDAAPVRQEARAESASDGEDEDAGPAKAVDDDEEDEDEDEEDEEISVSTLMLLMRTDWLRSFILHLLPTSYHSC